MAAGWGHVAASLFRGYIFMNGPDRTESSLQLKSLSPLLGMMLRVLGTVTHLFGEEPPGMQRLCRTHAQDLTPLYHFYQQLAALLIGVQS